MEVARRGLKPDDVTPCIPSLYQLLSKYAHGHSGLIVIRSGDFRPSECALLVTFMKVQDDWPNPLKWREEEENENDEAVA